MEGNQDIIKIKSSKENPESLSRKEKREKEKLRAKKKRDQIAKKEGEQSSAELVSGNLDEITAGSEEKTKGIDSKVREVASDPENQEVDEEIKRAGENTKAEMRKAEGLASQDIKKKNLVLNYNKAMEILEEIGLLEAEKNSGEVPDEPSEEAEKASELARAIENSKYIKEQEQLLTKLSSMHKSYRSAVYGNESNKIISEIHKLSQKDENNGKQYRDKVNSIIQSENVEKVNNDLKQLLEKLKAKQDSEESNVAEETEEKLPQKDETDGLKQESKVEKEKVYKIMDERGVELEFTSGEEIFINGMRYVFERITEEGKMVLDDGDRVYSSKDSIITKTKEGFCKYNLDQIVKKEGTITDERGEKMEFKKGDEIFLNFDRDYIKYIFEGLTKEGEMILDGGKYEINPRHYFITKTEPKQEKETVVEEIGWDDVQDELKESDKPEFKEIEEKKELEKGEEHISPENFEGHEYANIKKEPEVKKENDWMMELSEDQTEQETIKKLFEYILERARKVDVYEGFNENALKRIAIDQTKESYNKYK